MNIKTKTFCSLDAPFCLLHKLISIFSKLDRQTYVISCSFNLALTSLLISARKSQEERILDGANKLGGYLSISLLTSKLGFGFAFSKNTEWCLSQSVFVIFAKHPLLCDHFQKKLSHEILYERRMNKLSLRVSQIRTSHKIIAST